MKKKAQIIGMDLVMGVSIFLIAISVFFVMIRDSNTLISDKSINDVANYIMSNVENVPTTCSNCDFLEGSKFIKFNFGLFAGTGYAEKKSYILGDVDKLGFKEMIFCIYVKDYEGKIITYTGNNTIELSSGKNCNSEGEINKEDVNLKYIFYLMQTIKFDSKTHKRYYLSKYQTLNIPLPPIKTQEAIVSLLEKAEKAKELRNEADELSKDYLKSVFVDMFGNPVKNPKKFKVEELIKLCDLKSGGTPSRKEKEFFCGDIPWITTVALGKKHISSNDARDFITNDAVEKSATKIIPKGSIMVGIRVGVGKTSINLCDMCTSQDIISLVNIDQRLNKEFFLQIFKYYESYFENKKRGATIQGITSNILKELMIPLPPIELQNKFAEIVKQVETMKEHQKESKEQIDDLFNALMQKAFKGELKC